MGEAMHYQPSIVTLAKLEKFIARPGFAVRFHCATFELAAEGGMHSTVQVWVPASHAEPQLEHVARNLLAGRLSKLAEVALGDTRTQPLETARTRKKVEGRHVSGDPPHRVRRASKRRMPTRPEHIDDREGSRRASIERYILEGREPVRCDDLSSWNAWMETSARLVEDSTLEDDAHNVVRVCTVFLGVDVGFGAGQPILFETMILGGKWDRELFRYCTWEAAHEGHSAIVQGLIDSGPDAVSDWVLKARDLASMTLARSRKVAVRALVEKANAQFRKVK
jgi:hypothetical protein